MLWQMAQPVTVSAELRQVAGGHQIVAERLARAGFADPGKARAFLDPSAYAVSSPFDLPDMSIAVERLNRAVSKGESILIWGDFDVDGQTATALLFTALKKLGANVRYHVPLRDGEGHGMFLPKLREWLAQGVNVIITCDTGITAHESVRAAQTAGVDVIITDHHLLGDTLPEALAVINPMRLPHDHALRDLPGVAVAYELIAAFVGAGKCDDLLDLVALGIVGDVAVQRNETRYLLQRGLQVARLSVRKGLQSLLSLAGIDQLNLDETDIGFKIAPRLNAQGRLGNAADSVELLSTDDQARAAELANQLEGMNARRKLESRLIEESAHSLLERDQSLLEYAAIVISHPEWMGGVAGIVANRLAVEFHKPVVLLCEDGEKAFGSARSVPGLNITDALKTCREKLLKFGGHAMAAGLSLRREDIFEFRRLLSRTVREMLPTADEPVLELDGELGLGEISMELAQDLRRLAPFGNGNPPLALVSRNLRLVRKKKLGRQGGHLEFLVEDENGARQRVQWWKAGEQELPAGRFDLAYNPAISRFGNQPEVVLEYLDLKSLESVTPEIGEQVPAYEIEDYRHELEPKAKLGEVLKKYSDSIVWREDNAAINGCNRAELQPAESLIVWTIPPGHEEWQAALNTVEPQRLIIFGQMPTVHTVESFLQRLGGLLKYTVTAKGGETTVNALAAAMAGRADAIRCGLKWYELSGQLAIQVLPRGAVLVRQSKDSPKQADLRSTEKLLERILEETLAFRKNWTV